MNQLKQLSERSFLKLFFFLFSGAFLIAAFFMPDRQDMIPGLLRIIQNPTLASTNYFSIGGYAATFLNMGLVGLICTLLYCVPGVTPASVSVLAVIYGPPCWALCSSASSSESLWVIIPI